MKVILTTNIKKLGKIGDLVSVKDGYARNYLIPKGMALRENKKNLEYYNNIKEDIKNREEKKLQEAKNIIEKIKNLNVEFSKEADEKDQLYGSISKKEIIDYLSDKSLRVRSDDLQIKNQIKSIGEHTVVINPYENIIEEFTITVNKN